jgi:hypothetical protein
LVAFLVLPVEVAVAASITRGPYLQLLTTNGVTVVWNTDTPATCALEIGPVGGARAVIGSGRDRVCVVRAAGLSPGTEYAYRPLADGEPVAAESIFRTDDPAAPYAFVVVGDSGCGCPTQLAVRDRMLRVPADFFLSTGDMIYEVARPEEFDPGFFVPYRDLIRRRVFWPVLGNHDIQTAGGQPWRDVFHTPANNPAGSEHYYSFRYGNVHVVVLDSNAATGPTSAQSRFLDQEFATSTAVWKVVAFHHTIYSSGAHGSATAIRANLVPVFDRHRVDLVFMGHDHIYERTRPLRADQIVGAGDGTVYVTTGGGGKSITAAGGAAFTAYTESSFHFVRVAVDGGVLNAEMIRADGSVGDLFTLTKGAVAPAPACGDEIVNQPGEACDGGDRPACTGPCTPDCQCAPVCGDGVVDPATEACDGADAAACPGLCLVDCTCGSADDFVTLAPLADTYVENGAQATWDHGAATRVQVDDSPIDVAYLTFDLDGLPAPVARGWLTLACTNGSADGGTVHPVASTAWVEGDRTGSDASAASGPGLKWSQVDTNADGQLSDADVSPFLPDLVHPLGTFGAVVAGQSYRVDVTPALGGGGRRSFAVVSSSTDSAIYASRQHATAGLRPFLRVELARATPCSDDAVCDDGLGCTGVETCVGGRCRDGVPPACGDGFACTVDRCVEPGTCVHEARVCDDGAACTVDGCVEAAGGCVHQPDHGACDDGDACTSDACAPSGCTHGDSGLCTPVVHQLVPIADTYIEVGTEATWDHGLRPLLDVDGSPSGLIYLKFDLGVAPGPLQRATLRVHCTNSSVDGGTIYRAPASSWVEGDRGGTSSSSAGGPGLKWNDVDTNRDGVLDGRDTSPWLPDLAHPFSSFGQVTNGQAGTVDVTSALAGAAGTVTLVIRSTNSDGSTYASREASTAAQRPLLVLEYPPSNPGATTTTVTTTTTTATTSTATTTTATSTTGSTTTATTTSDTSSTATTTTVTTTTATTTTATTTTVTTTSTTPPTTATTTTLAATIRDLAPVADTYIEAGSQSTWDHGRSDHLDVDASPVDFTYLRFDLPAMPGTLVSAALTVFCSNAATDGGTVFPVASSAWIEGTRSGTSSSSAQGNGLKWSDVDTDRNGTIDTRDTSPFVPDFTRPIGALGAVAVGQAKTVDVTAAFRSGAGVYTLAIRSLNSNGATYSSREHSSATQRPRLRVTWR